MNNIWKIVLSYLKRPIRTFNVENRAQKIISQSKATPAPHHESTKKQIEVAKATHPDFMEKHYTKDAQLDERLKEVYVSSLGHTLSKDVTKTSNETAPQRKSSDQFEFGACEPRIIPKGKATLKQILTFLSHHQNDPVKNHSQKIAEYYKLDIQAVDNILKYHQLYKLHVPKDEDDSTFSEWKRTWKEDMKILR